MNEIVEDSLHRKIFHSYDHHILHEEGPDQENRKQREREHSVLKGKDRQFFSFKLFMESLMHYGFV